jgi:tripartite-type tricarboxylate transporter receptor subunit TctC
MIKGASFTRACALAAMAAGLAFAGAAQAQDFPSKSITIIVPFPPGGFVDASARLLQPELEKRLGRSVVIDNRSGAGGAVGTQAVVRAEADGHTLLAVASSHAVAPAVNPNLSYDTVKDLAPIIMIARDPMLFVVGDKLPVKSLKDLAELAKTKAGGLNYSSPGFGSQTQFIAELFNLRAGVKITHVPFRGGAPALQAVVQGDVEFTILSGQVTLPQIEARAIRALALGGAERDPRTPNTPTVAEAGFPDVVAIQWVGLFAPAKTPQPVIARINAVVNEALREKAVRDRLALQGMSALGGAPAVLGQAVESEVPLWKDIAQKAKMKLTE